MSNIITVTFSCGSTTASASGLWQYDYGQKLIFAGLDLPPAYEVHFANEGDTETITALGDETGVDIPDQFLLSGNAVRAWVFLHTGTEDGETMYAVRMPVNKRPEPSDIEPTPVQQDIITQAIAALNSAVEQTGQDVETTAGYMDRAEQAADRAEQSAQGVEDYAERAETAAESAEASASSAGQSEQTATQSAQSALQAATQAGTSASQAQQAASDADQAATSAVSAAEQAETSATTAETKAAEAVASASAAAGSAASAAGSETVASQAAQTASQAATQASQSATSASNSATSAAQSAASAEQSAQSAQTAEQSVESILDVLPEIQQDITDLQDTKADKNGSYDNLTAGLAEQLTTDQGITDSVPYLMRPSGGGLAVGSYEQDKIVGGSVVWNQLIQNGNFADNSGWSAIASNHETLAIDNGIATMTAISGNTAKGITRRTVIPSLANHKIFFSVMVNPSANIGVRIGGPSAVAGNYRDASFYATANTWNHINKVLTVASDNTTRNINLYLDTVGQLSAGDTVQVKQFYAIDLTAMFGTTIADYIYGLETATAGAGVAWLKQHFPAQFCSGYQEYNAGEIKSVGGLVSHDTTGLNQWDEELEAGQYNTATGAKESYSGRYRSKNLIPCLPNTVYYHSKSMQLLYYDSKKQFLSPRNGGFLSAREFTTPDSCYYITFNITEVTKNNGDICINFSDPAKNGTYEPYEVHSYPLDSTLTLRGIPKLDANNQLYYDGDTYSADGTVERRFAERAYQSGDESLTDALTDGTVTVYKLATPTTETATPYQMPQLVDPDGTEEYVLSDGAFPMPVGHETFYPMDLKKKIEDLPDSFVSDVQVDGVSVVQDGVANVPKELPNAPSSGEYVLKSNNGAVSWGSAPSGGGNSWELIVRYTVTGDSAQVDVNTDTNGQAFSLLKMLTRVKLPASLTGTNDYIKGVTFATNSGGTVLNAGLPTLRYGGTDKGYLEYIHEIMGDIMVVNARSSSSNGASSNVASLSNPDIGNANAYRTINGIRLQQYNSSSTMIPAGTIIEIYGIRQ